MFEKYCVIDIGTNSIRMLIAEAVGKKLNIIKKDLEMTRIGKGVDKTKHLSQDGMDRTIEAIKKFKEAAQVKGVLNIYAIATSAVRDAENKLDFIDRVKRETGIEIQVISGEREAELGFKGVIGGIGCNGNILTIDIGGGSTELILGNNKGIIFSKSIDIGAVRLTDKFVTTDPISEAELNLINNYIKSSIKDYLDRLKDFNIDKVVGIGGTITTLAAIKEEMSQYDRNKIHNSSLTLEDIKVSIIKFINMTNDERKNIRGLQPKRADIILAGSLILLHLMKGISKKEIIVSDYDNLEGFIFAAQSK